MKRVVVHLPESDIDLLDRVANKDGVTRGEVIRRTLKSKGLTTGSLQRISAALRRRFDGTFSAQQAERAAEVAVCVIASETKHAG